MSLQTSRGIVLSQVKYSETSLIVKIYTEKFGLASYLFKGVRKNKPSTAPALLQHLSIVEIVVQHKENKGIHFVKEIRSLYPYSSLPFDIRKSSIGLFVNELLIKSLREEEPNNDLFDFLITALQILDISQDPIQNFHCWFALQLTRFLGFLPGAKISGQERTFDMKEGVFLASVPAHNHFVLSPYDKFFLEFSRPGFREFSTIIIPNADRRYLLRKIIEYYQLHLQGFGQMKSHEILEEVLG